jgi:hypothetical protein
MTGESALVVRHWLVVELLRLLCCLWNYSPCRPLDFPDTVTWDPQKAAVVLMAFVVTLDLPHLCSSSDHVCSVPDFSVSVSLHWNSGVDVPESSLGAYSELSSSPAPPSPFGPEQLAICPEEAFEQSAGEQHQLTIWLSLVRGGWIRALRLRDCCGAGSRVRFVRRLL